jgi:hypothetical protein
MMAIRSRLVIKNITGKEVPAAIAAQRIGTITKITKAFRNIAGTSFLRFDSMYSVL